MYGIVVDIDIQEPFSCSPESPPFFLSPFENNELWLACSVVFNSATFFFGLLFFLVFYSYVFLPFPFFGVLAYGDHDDMSIPWKVETL